jgi:hypothetical protein
VKGTIGSGCEVKKGDNAEKLESCKRTPVQPVSAIRGEAKARDNAEGAGSGGSVGGDRVRVREMATVPGVREGGERVRVRVRVRG